MTVLIAEDDDGSRTILAAQLKRLGHTVISTEDGNEAWAAYQRFLPTVVITDWMMPGIDGLELCRRIRDVQRTEYTYLMILTSVERQGAYIEGMSSGADDFINKPADAAELTVRLRVAERILALKTEKGHLERLLPICPSCKRILGDAKGWEPVESYISDRSEAQFSHGICPECYKSVVEPQLVALRRRNQTQGV
jgi:phosphoserine phosphatase RsbU/P